MDFLKRQLADTLARQIEVQNAMNGTPVGATLSALIAEDRFLSVRINDLCRMVFGKPASQVDWEAYWAAAA